jgi:hypothetical protein
MAKKEYFSHDYYARQDPKIINLIVKCGMEGYGAYWALIEFLHQQGGKVKRNEINSFFLSISVSEKVAKAILNESGLIKANKTYYFSERVASNLKKRQDISDKRRAAIQERWEKDSDTNVLQSEYKCITKDKICNTKVIQNDTNIKRNINNNIKKRVSKDTPKESGGERLVDAFEKYAGDNENIIQAFKDFEEMRKKIRKPLTDKAKELIVKELKNLTKDDETLTLAILNQSIRNCWQDVFPLRQSQEQDKPKANGVSNSQKGVQPKSREYSESEMNELFDDMEDLR